MTQHKEYLHGVDSNVNAPVKESIIDLLGEEALAANVGERLVQDLVAGRLDNLDLKSTLLSKLREVGLFSTARNSLRMPLTRPVTKLHCLCPAVPADMPSKESITLRRSRVR